MSTIIYLKDKKTLVSDTKVSWGYEWLWVINKINYLWDTMYWIVWNCISSILIQEIYEEEIYNFKYILDIKKFIIKLKENLPKDSEFTFIIINQKLEIIIDSELNIEEITRDIAIWSWAKQTMAILKYNKLYWNYLWIDTDEWLISYMNTVFETISKLDANTNNIITINKYER